MLFLKGIFFMLCLYCINCKCRGISTREAKSLYQNHPEPFLMSNEFTLNYVRKDNFKDSKTGKGNELDSNQIPWRKASTSTESSTDKNYWLSEFGETDKIITVRVSSSVAKSSEQPKLNLGFAVPKVTYDYQYSPGPLWIRHTTETPANDSEGSYYETRIEAVSSRREVVFGRPRATSTTPRYECCEVPETNYELSEKNYELPEKNYELPEKNYELPEKNYELPEKNYELPEKNYELPEKNYELPEKNYELPEKNYEVPEKSYEMEEAEALMSSGGDKGKLGYVLEGRDFRKYRVEERTPDGFIVGEYGFIRNEDGRLHGVRYTADINANPRLIYDALVKFLSL